MEGFRVLASVVLAVLAMPPLLMGWLIMWLASKIQPSGCEWIEWHSIAVIFGKIRH
jgi:ABC-type tungstate transport system substrate-binding protein